jgi:hypothetical protein
MSQQAKSPSTLADPPQRKAAWSVVRGAPIGPAGVDRRPERGASRLPDVFLKRDIIVELDRPYITMPEAGREQPTLSVLWRVAAGLNLGAGDLATRVDKQLVLASRLRPAGRA